MRFNIFEDKVQKDYERIRTLHWAHFSFLSIALILLMFHDFASLWTLFTILVLVFFYRYYLKTVKEVMYTFWTFSFFLLIYLSVGLVKSMFVYDGMGLLTAHLLAIIFLLLEMYILSSPIYFPRVNWWEYDFRYRHELKVDVFCGDDKDEGRLSDLRRGAGCLVSFKNYKLGEEIDIKLSKKYENLLLRGDVVSKRINSIGRGYVYGVKINFGSEEEKRKFTLFSNKWRSESSFKTRMKFKRLKEVEVEADV